MYSVQLAKGLLLVGSGFSAAMWSRIILCEEICWHK